MVRTDQPTRENRTIPVDGNDAAPDVPLLDAPNALVECVLAFLRALGLQLPHQSTCHDGRRLPRQAHDARLRLGGLPIWRVPCTRCNAVFPG